MNTPENETTSQLPIESTAAALSESELPPVLPSAAPEPPGVLEPTVPPVPPTPPTPATPVPPVPPTSAAPVKCYHAMNCNRRIAGILFNVYGQLAGTWCGVYATGDESEIATLDALVAAKGNVTSIGQAEFEKLAKKKATASQDLNRLETPHVSMRVETHQIISKPGVQLVENPSPESTQPKSAVTSDPLPTAADALKVEKVQG